ncbi:Imm50 family immunity protein [Streptomyces sp. DSM 44917]|uniref:Imm50 family immunity protein n=1 Tax=Streptomyces boetiae TaxID=3075541 RepID=A0ABU2LDB5_9ACTN|nr:Imm50 family immunity protein [Streptomyces sp. DSM 44917]MDT0309575.1 Imm50 family immunity protein [Streptomyces sp. DSM 44917]
MTLRWAELVANRERLERYYDAVPPLDGVLVRAVHLDRDGPTVTMRLELGAFPDRPEAEWVAEGCDRLQCHLRFLDVGDLKVSGWPLSASGGVRLERLAPAERRRIAVEVGGAGGALMRFTSNASLAVGHFAALRGGGDTYWHAGPVDRLRLGNGLPDVTDHVFYERL